MLQELPTEATIDAIVDDVVNLQGWGDIGSKVVYRRNFKDMPDVEHVIGELQNPPYALLLQEGVPQAVIYTHEDLGCRDAALEMAQAAAEAMKGKVEDEPPLAISAIGSGKTGFLISVAQKVKNRWVPVSCHGQPMSWMPTPKDVEQIRAKQDCLELEPHIPTSSKLKKVCERIDRTLRDAKIKDSERALIVGAASLALWYTKGKIRRTADFVIHDINRATKAAFAQAGWGEPPRPLIINEQNVLLAERLWRVILELEKLGLAVATENHDFLGQIYEYVVRYSSGNTLGQYFTPMHIARFMAQLADVRPESVILDPTCGTGGLYVAAIGVAREQAGTSYAETARLMKHNLYGYEVEPSTAALCLVNLILRGIGGANVRCADCFSEKADALGVADVVLMNPPFPHRKSDTPTEAYIERGLEGAKREGVVAAIVPTSILATRKTKQWRRRILENNTLLAVIQLPDDLFQPYAAVTTSLILLKRGVPHTSDAKTVFVRIEHDGYTLHRGSRIATDETQNQLPLALDAVTRMLEIPGVSGIATIKGEDEWSAGAYVSTGCLDKEEFKKTLSDMLKVWASFYIRYDDEILEQRKQIVRGDITCESYRDIISHGRLNNARSLCSEPGTIGGEFDILYAMQDLDKVDSLSPGPALVISSTGQYNGCRGWYTYPRTIEPPFITVPCTGSIGEAFVQLEPCAVTSNCLILLPKNPKQFNIVRMAMVATAIRMEKWRFSYGRTLTPQRLAELNIPSDPELEVWTKTRMEAVFNIIDTALKGALERII